MSDLYADDFVSWADHQADALRRRAANEIDWENVAEEIETLGRSERSRLASHICTILEHFMRLQTSPATDPRRGWRATIGRAQLDVAKALRENPGLKPTVAAVIAGELPTARQLAAIAMEEYGETPVIPLGKLNYTEDQVIGRWLPE